MKALILAITISLATPAYALPTDTDCDQLKQCSDKLSDTIEAAKKKELPLSDADKEEMKKAVDDFDKAMKNFYEIDDKKIAKKHPKLKSIGHGFLAVVGGLRSTRTAGYGSPFYTGGGNSLLPPLGMPTMGTIIGPPSSMAPGGIYPVMNNGMGTTFLPLGLPR